MKTVSITGLVHVPEVHVAFKRENGLVTRSFYSCGKKAG